MEKETTLKSISTPELLRPLDRGIIETLKFLNLLTRMMSTMLEHFDKNDVFEYIRK